MSPGGAHGGAVHHAKESYARGALGWHRWRPGAGVVIDDSSPAREGRPVDQLALARTMVQLADTLVDDFDVVELLTNLAHQCVTLLDVSAAGLTLLGVEGDQRTLAASNETTEMLELLELQTNEGPSFDCFRMGLPVVCEDLAQARARWERFAPEAVRAGFRSVHAVPMRHRGTVIGALLLFCDVPGVLGPEERSTAQALADMATIGVLHHQALAEAKLLNDQLQRALDSRVVIEQAKGIIADRLGIDVEDAFARLRTHARAHRQRLVAAADDVVRGRLSPLSLQ